MKLKPLKVVKLANVKVTKNPVRDAYERGAMDGYAFGYDDGSSGTPYGKSKRRLLDNARIYYGK